MKNKEIGWNDVKKGLKEFSQEDLIQLVKDLYDRSPVNKSFLQVRFTGNRSEKLLEPYRKRVEAPFSCGKTTFPSLRLTDAKRAISEYKSATDDKEGILELKFLYLDRMVYCFTEFGVDLDSYYDAMVTALDSFLKEIKEANSAKFYEQFDKRFKFLRTRDDNWGYGFEDDLDDAFREYDEEWEKLK